ncbi:LuxR C-terminal-related transcriptional regulator [Erythrobacter sp. HKB08]|uniref:helix-turn-helix domain-containing protein n=1 Tax=Erythrobacter sp. HKB08 TaxID=2502843 RepID=UPI001008902E|nr:LuxR C-terminal-related transcriptional regulator [Erythrobacter sp. HKB08]
MTDGLAQLTEKEKETLRLMVRGHDAKSMARELSLSVHTINDRLRAARRKLGVTSSKEAARKLFETECEAPESFAAKDLGGAPESGGGDGATASDGHHSKASRNVLIGAALMSLIFASLLLATQGTSPEAMPATPDTPTDASRMAAAAPVPQEELEQAELVARAWLGLVDGKDFGPDSRTTAPDERNLEGWNSLVERRMEVGRATKREAQRISVIERDGLDEWTVYFHTDFERFRGAYEKVTLAYDGQAFITRDYEFE